ncbi:MAG: hypothetical protein IJP49_00335 [Bacteroidales bacterium]|nr:hypothetical protein [Bacteroidales bacterium]
MFKTAVVEHGFIYDRFSEDFVNSHTFHDSADADSRNDHKVNLGRIGSLLVTREDLVWKYSDLDLTDEQFFLCMREFMLTREKTDSRALNFDCELTTATLKTITKAANDIPLFKRDVTSYEMRRLFNKSVQIYENPLVANRNDVVAYFFSRLNFHGIICNKYQSVLACNNLVMSSTERHYLTRTDISSALYNISSTDNPIMKKIEKWVVLIKSTTFNQL